MATMYCYEDGSSSMPAITVDNDMVLFGVPKKGRIHEEVMKMLKGAGIDAKRPDRLDVAVCKDLNIKIVFLPAADIPSYVMEGNVDIGISGGDMLEEAMLEANFNGYSDSAESPVKVLTKLGIGKCKLCLQAPVAQCKAPAWQFAGKRIVTSFPYLTAKFFKQLEDEKAKQQETCPKTHIKTVSGSVEAACCLGLADAVVDLVETGTTMKAAGLDIVTDVLETEALLFHRKHSSTEGVPGKKDALIELIQKRIEGYLTATRYVMIVCNCMHADLTKICEILPGKRSPTVTSLNETDWHAVSALVLIKESHAVMDRLEKQGAKDILCFSLSNTRM